MVTSKGPTRRGRPVAAHERRRPETEGHPAEGAHRLSLSFGPKCAILALEAIHTGTLPGPGAAVNCSLNRLKIHKINCKIK